MKSPFPLQVTENGRLLREVVPLTYDQFMEEIEKMQDPPSPATASRYFLVNIGLEAFTRNLDATGLLDENGMVKR